MLNFSHLTRVFFSKENQHLARLMTRVPKTVGVDLGGSFLSRIFEQSKKSPTYLLLKELFVYLQESQLLNEEFPFIKSDVRFQENWMAMHLQILKSRLREERTRSQAINELQLQKLNYNAQVYFFPAYAKYLNPQTPADNYATHFAQAFLRRFQIYDQQFLEHYETNPTQPALSNILRRLIYQNRVSQQDAELSKLTRYYLAHRRYLSMLEWPDLIGNKVKWGFEGDRILLGDL